MESVQAYLTLAHQFLPAQLWNKVVVFLGYFGLLTQAVPALVTWGGPAATRAADWLAKVALNSPFRPLIIWLAPRIITFLDALTAALTQLLNTFKNELEADLKAAAAADAAKASQPVPVPQPEAQGAPKSGV